MPTGSNSAESAGLGAIISSPQSVPTRLISFDIASCSTIGDAPGSHWCKNSTLRSSLLDFSTRPVVDLLVTFTPRPSETLLCPRSNDAFVQPGYNAVPPWKGPYQ